MAKDSVLELIGRDAPLFEKDILKYEYEIRNIISNSRFLVIGGAGSIGSAVVKELFSRNPRLLHVVDISENNMVEVVRELRSTIGYIDGEFATYALDCGSEIFETFIEDGKRRFGGYDYIFNLSALKHVRSEKDPYTLMRMIDVNIFNTDKTIQMAESMGAKKYFCVSTDKAANPVNMMGASKRIMEMFLMRRSETMPISTARFANVAFSDGSLLYGFNRRLEKMQPIAAPNDVRRYFVTPKESGELCLMSCLFGDNRDVFFPKLDESIHMLTFSDICNKYLISKGYIPLECGSEEEARAKMTECLCSEKRYWPVYYFKSDTTGEKDYEEFYTNNEIIDIDKYSGIGVIKNKAVYNDTLIEKFIYSIDMLKKQGWSRKELIDLFNEVIPNFNHIETGKFLDQKM